MAYTDFTLREAVDRFGLALADVPDLFADAPEVEPSQLMRMMLPEFVPLALAINTEKARSELVIGPLLAALRAQLGHRFSLFSGVEFAVDPAQGLTGFCDFLLSRSPDQQILRDPVAAVVEAKNENLKAGLGQCIAAMVAARLFNEREGRPGRPVYGAVSSGTAWRFLRLDGPAVGLDQREYHVSQMPKLVGILTRVVTGDGG